VLRCKELSELSEDYLDDNLPFRKKAFVLLHLFLCKHCRRYLTQLQVTREVIHQSENTTMRKADEKPLIDNIMKQIEVEAKKRS